MGPASGRTAARKVWEALPKRPRGVKRALSVFSSLNDLGWQRSAATGAAVRSDGSPLAWYTYPALLWLEPRLRSSDVVFEYGAGNSTQWYAARVAEVVSVEHDPAWAASVQSTAPANATVLHRECQGDETVAPPDDPYVTAIADRGIASFDIVVVDGRARVSCVDYLLGRLTPSALLILDNSDRPQYGPALQQLGAEGLLRIDFAGPAPGSGRLSYTSVFGRNLDRWLSEHPLLPHLGY